MFCHLRRLAPAAAIALLACGSPPAFGLTLAEAWRIAESKNPALATEIARLTGAEGALVEAQQPLWNNPQVSTEQTQRSVPVPASDGRTVTHEWNAGISQTFETGGQQRYRRQAAASELEAIRADIAERRRRVRFDVEQAYVRALAVQSRLAKESEALKLLSDAAAIVEKRLAAGEDTRLDANLATVEAERARYQLLGSEAQLLEARASLATLLQLPPGELPTVEGDVELTEQMYSLEQLLGASQQRHQLRALERRETAARERLAVERASTAPDVTVGLSVGREAPRDERERFVGLSFSVPLPLFRRNQAGIGRASTELTQSTIERQTAQRNGAAEVRDLWQRVERLKVRASSLQSGVVGRLADNQRLSVRAYQAGELSLLQLILVNRQLLDSQRDLIEARTDLRLAIAALENAAGWPLEPQ